MPLNLGHSTSAPEYLKYLKKDAVPEIKGYHLKTMGILLVVGLVDIGSFLIPTQIFGMELTWVMAAPIMCAPPVFLIVMMARATFVRCPNCKGKMQKAERIEVVESHKIFGKFPYSPWNVFHCAFCKRSWRVPALDGKAHYVSEKEIKEIEHDREGNRCPAG